MCHKPKKKQKAQPRWQKNKQIPTSRALESVTENKSLKSVAFIPALMFSELCWVLVFVLFLLSMWLL